MRSSTGALISELSRRIACWRDWSRSSAICPSMVIAAYPSPARGAIHDKGAIPAWTAPCHTNHTLEFPASRSDAGSRTRCVSTRADATSDAFSSPPRRRPTYQPVYVLSRSIRRGWWDSVGVPPPPPRPAYPHRREGGSTIIYWTSLTIRVRICAMIAVKGKGEALRAATLRGSIAQALPTVRGRAITSHAVGGRA